MELFAGGIVEAAERKGGVPVGGWIRGDLAGNKDPIGDGRHHPLCESGGGDWFSVQVDLVGDHLGFVPEGSTEPFRCGGMRRLWRRVNGLRKCVNVAAVDEWIDRSRILGVRSRRLGDVKQIPGVAIGIEEAVLIHEAEIFGGFDGGTSGLNGFSNEVVHFVPAGAGEAVEDFEELGGVADGAWGEGGESGLCGEHELDGVADGDADVVFAAERLVAGEAEGEVEGLGFGDVLGGHVDEDLAGHGGWGALVQDDRVEVNGAKLGGRGWRGKVEDAERSLTGKDDCCR